MRGVNRRSDGRSGPIGAWRRARAGGPGWPPAAKSRTVFLAGCSVGSWWFFSKGKPKSRLRPTCAPAGTRPRQRCASPRSRWRRPRCRSRNRAGPHRRSARARPDSATRPVRCRRVSPIAIGTGQRYVPDDRGESDPHRLGGGSLCFRRQGERDEERRGDGAARARATQPASRSRSPRDDAHVDE